MFRSASTVSCPGGAPCQTANRPLRPLSRPGLMCLKLTSAAEPRVPLGPRPPCKRSATPEELAFTTRKSKKKKKKKRKKSQKFHLTLRSYIWIFPDASFVPGYAVGCDASNAAADVFAPLGPCSGGCHNFFFGGPNINSYIYAIGRNKGLTRSHTEALVNGDLACPMGTLLAFAGTQRRGFNALKLKALGLVTAVTVAAGSSSSTFLSSLYNYEFVRQAGATTLLQLGGTQIYLSFRSEREWTVDRNNNFGSRYMKFGTTINGATHVLRANSDGSSTLLAVILTGQTYSVPLTSFSVRQDWATNYGAQLSITATGTFPSPVAQPATTYLPADTVQWNTGLQNTAEQGAIATASYGGSAVLNINWAGDDRNSSVFIRAQVNVPAASTIVSASLYLEVDADQLQAQQGTTQTYIAAEQSINCQAYSGNLFTRSYFPPVATAFSGDYFVGDEIVVDVRAQVQQVVSQANWQPGNYISLIIYSAVVNQQLTRTAQSGYACGLIGGPSYCGPRIKITYTSNGGGLPAPVNCVSSWSAWSVCANSGNTCGAAGTQDRNLLVTVPAANGGTACPSPTRQTQACTTAPCVVVVKVLCETPLFFVCLLKNVRFQRIVFGHGVLGLLAKGAALPLERELGRL